MIAVKKFDAILKPYMIRVNKSHELEVQLGNLKKHIFEKDYTVTEFF
jgi:hypothetical protein